MPKNWNSLLNTICTVVFSSLRLYSLFSFFKWDSLTNSVSDVWLLYQIDSWVDLSILWLITSLTGFILAEPTLWSLSWSRILLPSFRQYGWWNNFKVLSSCFWTYSDSFLDQNVLIFILFFFFHESLPFPYGHTVLSTNIILTHLEGTWARSFPGVNTILFLCSLFQPGGKFCRDHLHSLLSVKWRQAHKRKCLKDYSDLGRARTAPKIVESHVIDS